MINRVGHIKYQFLAAALFSPAIAMANGNFILWGICQIFSLFVVHIYNVKYNLSEFKNIYIAWNLMALFLGISFFMMHEIRYAIGFIWFFLFFMMFYRPSLRLMEIFSKK